jgi:alanyl-tRNA synthetase
MKGSEIRQSFLEYFESKGHKVIKSSPLIPASDPTLLFVNAGMVQFKNVFLGQEDVGTKRATSSQKCLRVSGKHNDFENVGRTPRHHTFFEMLGNFSFGDYFKKEAIEFAWEFVTKILNISPDLLTATVFEKDDDAARLWAEISSLPAERIVRLGEEENFWSMGDTGPCGPCAEIHVDLRPGTPGGIKEDPERFLEIWNLVFMQYNRDDKGNMTPLPAPSVDTGAGLERIAAFLQGVPTNYDTDLFAPIRRQIADISGKKYGEDENATVSMRVICDHVRAMTFLIGDAVLPSNLGRGYVLRRIMRRAARHGVLLGIEKPFLHKMVGSVIETMRDAYPELEQRRGYIEKVVLNEEERFLRTLAKGLKLLDDERGRMTKDGEKVLRGEFAFKLYDTFGFPLDLTQDIGRSNDFTVDENSFAAALKLQREKSGKGSKFGAEAGMGAALGELAANGATTKFVGYETLSANAEILGIVSGGELVSEAKTGDEVDIVTDLTPFYAERGGQVGDAGSAEIGGAKVSIAGALPAGESLITHKARVECGLVRVGQTIALSVDVQRRNAIQRNHTATHLLHYALREVLGEDARQAGSLVAPDRLRFDFTHFQAVTDDELREVQRIANQLVLKNEPVQTDVKSYDEALSSGAVALFGEKYGDEVRVVGCGVANELCGGTHVARSGDIGPIIITDESSIAAGVRRIEAVTGDGALEKIQSMMDASKALTLLYKVPAEQILERAQSVSEHVREQDKEIMGLREKLSAQSDGDLLDKVRDINGVKLLAAVTKAADANQLRLQGIRLRDQLGGCVVVLGAEVKGKAMLCCLVTKDLTDRYKAGKIVGALAKIVGGGGGGKPDMAQAGGSDPSKLQDAVDVAEELIRS